MISLLQQWITQQAEQRPDATAIVLHENRLSYAELEQRSNQLARLLKDAGCQRGDRVGFLIPKTPAAIISILGILKADCTYVPLDRGATPPRRDR